MLLRLDGIELLKEDGLGFDRVLDIRIRQIIDVVFDLFRCSLRPATGAVELHLPLVLLIAANIGHLRLPIPLLLVVLLLEPIFQLDLLRRRIRVPLLQDLVDLLLNGQNFASSTPLLKLELLSADPCILSPQHVVLLLSYHHLLLFVSGSGFTLQGALIVEH